MSGGRATLVSRRGRGNRVTAQSGDISAIHPMGHALLQLFQIECKFYKNLKWEVVARGKAGYMPEIWTPTLEQAQEHGREPWIIARENRQDEVLLTTETGMAWINACCSGEKVRANTIFPKWGAYMLPFRDVLLQCCPDLIRAKAKELESSMDPVVLVKPARYPGRAASAVTIRRNFPSADKGLRRMFPVV